MEQNEEIEMQVWEYIDGICTEAERERIAGLIANDELWSSKYNELVALNEEIASNLEMEQPSMRFTKNVMEMVADVKIAPAAKQYINYGIIKGIAAFFIITITGFLGYALLNEKWGSAGTTYNFNALNLNKLQLPSLFNSGVFNLIIALNIILALVFADMILRRKKASAV
jgi:hypothetical protein